MLPPAAEAIEPPAGESPPSSAAEPRVVEESAVEESAAEPIAAAAQSELPPPPPPPPSAFTERELPPSLPQALPSNVGPAAFPPMAAAASVPERLAALQARIVESVPPRWVEVARQYPVLWLVVAPVVLAFMLIFIVMAFEPEPAADVTPSTPTASAAAAQATAEPAPAAPTPAKAELDAAGVAALESKPATSLSIDELLLLNQSRAQHKRSAVKALSQKLQASPALIEDASVQGELLRFAADPDTAAGALATMAQARAPFGPDLLYEVWTHRATGAGTAELARSLLYSRDVRPHASPALAVALDLRAAEGCEAVQAALPKTQSEGDARALPSLIKLTSRRGCGEKKRDDCYACLRSQTKQIIAATRAAKSRRAPSYPAP